MKRKFIGLAACISLIAFSGISHAESKLQTIVNSDHRSSENKTRDAFRHPIETLKFFDIKPEHTVVEINPGGGWYTEILGPYLKESGTLYLAIFSDESARSYAPRLNAKSKTMTANKELYGEVHYTVMDTPTHVGPVAPDGSADRVLTFRNVHNWMADNSGEAAFTSFYKALKPGGILGVVEHRAKTDKEQAPRALSGYVREDYVIKLAEKAGFKLVEKSEINANPKDTANYKDGVWSLPPSLRAKEKDDEKYLAIGESDRMTLKFIKPTN
ncbi:MAG: methyltransferase [Micavibrio sp. TMED27]|nr:methyltransferase [Micavibrio sp.]OUT91585.1 MAG: methyltransferase [Micavibrio sp. TMED27]|tara:strand:+ start:1038 stop:1850 length:813 start_codon:yes stop_codon:yes gene_type:complete